MLKKLKEICEKCVVQEGLSLYDMEYVAGQTLLRVYISQLDKITATLEDCVRVNHALTPFIDQAEWIPDNFQLEVSSPGVYRTLRTKEHFKSALGQIIKLKLSTKLSGAELPKALIGQKALRGALKTLNEQDDCIIIDVNSFPLMIKLSNITKAHVDPDWDSMGKSLEGDL
jgi:ribosome maturation factor RimP